MDIFKKGDKAKGQLQPVKIVSIMSLNIDTIRLNSEQPRKYFDQEKLDELADSIREYGVIEPVIVRPVDEELYELVAGERRFRAAVQAGLKSIPAIARALDDRQMLEVALIENTQREDIKPLECAQAYRKLIDEFGLSQEEIADRVGKKRSTIANTLRLLNLPPDILVSLDKEEISEGHARALLSLSSPDDQIAVWKKVIKQGLNVRETEGLSRRPSACKTTKTSHVARATKRHGHVDPNLADVEDKLRRFLATKVSITRGNGEKGKIEVEFYDDDDLMRIIDIIAQI